MVLLNMLRFKYLKGLQKVFVARINNMKRGHSFVNSMAQILNIK